MAINIDFYQDSGPLLAGRGTTTTLINNVGWMNSGAAEGLTYAEHPIIRPTTTPFARSFTYFSFFKLSGTYIKGSRVRIKVAGTPIAGVKVFCKLTDSYAAPTSNHDGDLVYRAADLTLFPRLSTVGPNTGLSYLQYLTGNTTYYTEFLKTQIYVEAGAEYNNNLIDIKCWVDEYEEDDV